MDGKNELVIRKVLDKQETNRFEEFPIFARHTYIIITFILTNLVSIICYKSLGLFWGLVVEPKVKEMKVKGPNGGKRFGDEDFYFFLFLWLWGLKVETLCVFFCVCWFFLNILVVCVV